MSHLHSANSYINSARLVGFDRKQISFDRSIDLAFLCFFPFSIQSHQRSLPPRLSLWSNHIPPVVCKPKLWLLSWRHERLLALRTVWATSTSEVLHLAAGAFNAVPKNVRSWILILRFCIPLIADKSMTQMSDAFPSPLPLCSLFLPEFFFGNPDRHQKNAETKLKPRKGDSS